MSFGGLPIVLFHNFMHRSQSTGFPTETSWYSHLWHCRPDKRADLHQFYQVYRDGLTVRAATFSPNDIETKNLQIPKAT